MSPTPTTRRRHAPRRPTALPVPPPEMAYLAPCGPTPPDARWHRARLLTEGRAMPGGPDDWVRRARDFLARSHERAAAPSRVSELGDLDPDVAAAHAVFASGDKFRRGTLEAWLLTGLGSAAVAERCDLTAAAVEAYHALFFNVRDKLATPLWVLLNALGTADLMAVGEGDVDVILKRFAHVGGRFLLELVLDAYRHGCAAPADLSGVALADLTRLRERLMGRALVLALVLPPGQMGRVAVLARLGRELDALIAARASGTPDPATATGVPWALFGRVAEAASTGVGWGEAA